jgi:hypothetical protein
MDEEGTRRDHEPEIPFLQRLYDRPFVLLVLGMGIMFLVFTAWGLWEVMSLPQATLP